MSNRLPTIDEIDDFVATAEDIDGESKFVPLSEKDADPNVDYDGYQGPRWYYALEFFINDDDELDYDVVVDEVTYEDEWKGYHSPNNNPVYLSMGYVSPGEEYWTGDVLAGIFAAGIDNPYSGEVVDEYS